LRDRVTIHRRSVKAGKIFRRPNLLAQNAAVPLGQTAEAGIERERMRADEFPGLDERMHSGSKHGRALARERDARYVFGAAAMQLRLLAFAHLPERLGFREMLVEYAETETPRELMQRLAPGVAWDGVRAAIDEEYHSWDQPIGTATELALIPPVSGG
jgi:molybdopterin synthase sulfur carrier subunit